jgi:uncharacterized protein (DUF58 family)
MSDDRSRDTLPAGTYIALLGLILVSLLLIGLAAMVAPHVLGIFLVLGLFCGAVAFHYLAWGWWLPRVLERAEQADAPPSTSEV